MRGGSEEIEDYVIEAERLLSLTIVSACTADYPDVRNILRENWSTDIQTQGEKHCQYFIRMPLTFFCNIEKKLQKVSGFTQVPAHD